MAGRASLAVLIAMALLGLQPANAAEAGDPASSDVCVGVGIGGSPPDQLACLNARLRRSAAAAQQQAAEVSDLAGSAARSSGPALNIFNETATRERLGDAFGHSPFPQRPRQTYDNPLLTGR